LQIRIPSSYYSAVQEYCKLTNTPVTEWFNNEILDSIEAIELGPATSTFIDKYSLRRLSKDKREALMQRHRTFKVREEKIGGED
jgi:hypothetical protein